MLVGHLPAGYVLTKTLQRKFKTSRYIFVGLIGSVFPDIDIFYFYLIDHRQNLHHSYWIHIPFYWIIIAAITFLLFWIVRQRAYLIAAIIFFSNIFLHFALDTIVGKIEWLYPITDKAYYLFDVPARYNFWMLNFIFHWTFLFEIAAILGAALLWIKTKRSYARLQR